MTLRSRNRPAGAIEPGPGQESAWDYPRPPRLEPAPERVRVVVDGVVLADTTRAYRVLETSHPPAYYVPAADVRMDLLVASPRASVCEFKGRATYVHLALPPGAGTSGLARYVEDVAWCQSFQSDARVANRTAARLSRRRVRVGSRAVMARVRVAEPDQMTRRTNK